ncbi:hypothetical protein FGG90_07885 [Clavibacter tessellarius]|uniref:Uncharacterized protein n=1 Tax=Clavibacter tessellarius TaxID=31965 RepID=A0A225C8J4_9MICO|nr:hypothetical protein [Clavibacter michiganensis]OQJ63087.1 hypothetical protein B5P24_08835 [Clavibacter michiganensis subsp. tessellarius]UKF33928.1 hypothetical protein FGG90_07885 [Clavibacter michiganensis subsp. tessellarius]
MSGTRGVLAIRVALIAVGVAGLVLGARTLLDTQRVDQVVGVAVFLLVAILVHDAILSPVVFVAGLLIRRAGRRVPPGAVVIVQAGVVVMALMTLVVVPEIRARAIGNDNPTILIADYAPRLALMWVATAVATAVIAALYARTRREKDRPPVTQD